MCDAEISCLYVQFSGRMSPAQLGLASSTFPSVTFQVSVCMTYPLPTPFVSSPIDLKQYRAQCI